MKKLLILSVILVFSFGANAQISKSKRPALPADLVKMVGEYPDQILKNKAIKSRMRSLLGKNYWSFFETFETQKPFEKRGNILFSSGCLIHACGHLESAIAINLTTKTIHIGIFRQGETSKIYSEDKRAIPKPLTDWFRNLSQKD